ncbi:MAG: hypothetical protein IJX39_05580 [Clostridia bacterium]|nr:hypothetical protein [Clostridia bacterium]
MKKNLTGILSVLLLLVLSLTTVSCADKDDTPDGMQNVSISTVNFDLFVPESWISQAESGISGARVSNTDTSNVTVTAYMPDAVMTVEEYWNSFCLPEYQNGVLKDFTVMEEQCGDTTLGGKNAKTYVFLYTVDGKTYESMQIITVKDDILYTLTYTAESSVYSTHLETVESIRSNFRFR